jgi:hypothetical protein
MPLASAFGRKQTVKIAYIGRIERPLLGKADIQPGTLENGLLSGCFTPDSRHWGDMLPRGRL